MLHEDIDFLDQIANAGERAVANGSRGDEAKPAFDLIEP